MDRIEPLQDFDTRTAARARVMKFHAPVRQRPLVDDCARRSRGAAIISVLLALTVLTIMVVAFLQSMRIDRLTARAYLNKTKADLMVEAGLSESKQLLSTQATNNAFISLRTANPSGIPYYYLGRTDKQASGVVEYHPLFSGGKSVSVSSRMATSADRLPAPTLNASLPTTRIQTALSDNPLLKAEVSWIPAHTTDKSGNSVVSGRYAYWIEDLDGYINPEIHGNKAGANDIHTRSDGLNPDEIALFTLFDSSRPFESGTPTANSLALINNRILLISAPSIRQIISSVKSTCMATKLRYATTESVVIPYGFDYAEEGQNKHLINDLISEGGDSAVVKIADAIKLNLPNFSDLRKGGLSGFDYNQQLAANIIDYADTNTAPTFKAGAYRGIDSYPFTNLAFDRISWIGGDGRTLNPVQIKIQTFVDVWNPHNKTISGAVSITNKNTFGVNVGGNKSFGTEVYSPVNVNLGPNGHVVLKAGETIYSFINGTGATSVASPLSWIGDKTDHNLEMYWNGILVDTFRGGAQRDGTGFLNSGDSQRKYKGNAVCLDYSLGQMGDPRASWFITASSFPRSYDSSTAWGGRQFATSIDNNNYKEVIFSRWPDPSSDGPAYPANTNPSILTGSDSVQAALENPPQVSQISQNGRGTWRGFAAGTLPTNIPLPTPQPLLAPSVISNTGQLSDMAELGNIYDPAQWKDITLASAKAEPSAGGGYSLRIGQAEFPVFDQLGSRASQLLDIFDTKASVDTTGKININTASRDALRALIAGVILNRDPLLQPPSLRNNLTAPFSTEAGDMFADAIIDSRPFLSISQLPHVKNSTGSYFGNPNQWPSNKPQMWNDAMREELFARIYRLCSVRGRNYRIYVVGQTLGSDGKVLAVSKKCFQVYVDPTPALPGTQTIKNIYEASF